MALDTEWADIEGAELVSLALIVEDYEHVFYAERNPLPTVATDFVRHELYPLLDRGAAAMPDAMMTAALRRLLASAPVPCVMSDYENAITFRHVLAEFDQPHDEAQACGPIPSPVETRMLRDGLTWMVLEDWFEAHPEQAKRRHHALVDAQALRMTWLAATGKVIALGWRR